MSTQAITPDQFMAQQSAPPPSALTPDSFMAKQSSVEKPAPASASERLGTNFLSGLGVTSDEQAKHFFAHPLDTVIKSFEAQGALAKKAREAYDRGDYMEALQHGLNYMVPFIGQQTDQAGTQLKEGDIAGGVGRTLGAAVPIIGGSPEVQATAGDVAAAAAAKGAQVIRASARGANAALAKAPGTVGGAVGAAAGGYLGGHIGAEVGGAAGAMAGRELLPQVRIPGEGFGFPSRVVGGPKTIEAEPPAVAATPAAVPAAASVQPPEAAVPAAAATPTGAGIPRTLSGESALRQILTGQDTPNLMKIAKSRGINVTQESQLKPSLAGPRLINKIIDDFEDDELSNVRDQYIENTRMGRHDFGDIGAEANKTLAMQAYFPDVKIPTSQLIRTKTAITNAPLKNATPETGALGDLAAQLKKTAKATKAKPAATAPATDLEDQVAEMLKQVKAGKTLRDLSAQ